MWAMSDDGVDPDGYPPPEPHAPPRRILVEVYEPTGGTVRIAVQHNEPDVTWVSRALHLAAEAVLITEDGPAITPAGHLVEREEGWETHA